jgi:uncharacterized protein YggT (Ycf19 family)
VIDPLSQILFLGRFLCFMALFYLVLHKIVARWSHKPKSRVLWFFDVLTAPLLRPVRGWIMPGASQDQLLSRALLFYGVLWLCLAVLGRIVAVLR